MLMCSNCGAQQPDDAAYCDECGTALRTARSTRGSAHATAIHSPTVPASDAPFTCPRCGAVLPVGSVFCHLCGVPLKAETHHQLTQVDLSAGRPQPLSGEGTPASAAQMPVRARLRLLVQPGEHEIALPDERTEYVLGRNDPVSQIYPDVDLTAYGGADMGVSRQHARLFIQGAAIYLEDRNSTNHSYVNGQTLAPWQPCLVRNADEIRLGRLRLKLCVD